MAKTTRKRNKTNRRKRQTRQKQTQRRQTQQKNYIKKGGNNRCEPGYNYQPESTEYTCPLCRNNGYTMKFKDIQFNGHINSAIHKTDVPCLACDEYHYCVPESVNKPNNYVHLRFPNKFQNIKKLVEHLKATDDEKHQQLKDKIGNDIDSLTLDQLTNVYDLMKREREQQRVEQTIGSITAAKQTTETKAKKKKPKSASKKLITPSIQEDVAAVEVIAAPEVIAQAEAAPMVEPMVEALVALEPVAPIQHEDIELVEAAVPNINVFIAQPPPADNVVLDYASTPRPFPPDEEPAFWRPIFGPGELNELKTWLTDNVDASNPELCNIVKQLVSQYRTKPFDPDAAKEVEYNQFNLMLCLVFFVAGVLTTKMSRQPYRIFIKGGKAGQIAASQKQGSDYVESNDIDMMILPNRWDRYNREEQYNLSLQIAYLIQWIVSKYGAYFSVLDPEDSRFKGRKYVNPDIVKLSFTPPTSAGKFMPLADINFGNIEAYIQEYYKKTARSQSDFLEPQKQNGNVVLRFNTQQVTNMVREKLDYLLIYYTILYSTNFIDDYTDFYVNVVNKIRNKIREEGSAQYLEENVIPKFERQIYYLMSIEPKSRHPNDPNAVHDETMYNLRQLLEDMRNKEKYDIGFTEDFIDFVIQQIDERATA